MSDELELVSENAAGDSWVDNVPSAVSTGFQNQNTATAAIFNGLDKSSCAVVGSNLIIYPSSIIDVNGLPFVVKSQITLALPTTGFNHYLKVVAGSTAILKEIEFTTDRGTYDTAKNGWYNGSGERVLNWVYNIVNNVLIRIPGTNIIKGDISDIYSETAYAKKSDLNYSNISSAVSQAVAPSQISGKIITGMCYNRSNDMLYVANTDGKIYVFNASDLSYDSLIDTSSSAIKYITIDQSTGNLIGSMSTAPYTIFVFDGLTSSVLSSFTPLGKSTLDYDNENGYLLAWNSTAADLYQYNVTTGTLLSTDPIADMDVASLYFSIDSNRNLLFHDTGANRLIVVDKEDLKIITKYAFSFSSVFIRTFDKKRGICYGTGDGDTLYKFGYYKE